MDYKRLGKLSLEDVLPFIGSTAGLEYVRRRPVKEFFGAKVAVDGPRLRTYKEKGLCCVRCGMSASFFAVERDLHNVKHGNFHLNLYGLDAEKQEVIFTVDHIIPASMGGPKVVSNLQPMCVRCNSQKRNLPDEVDKLLSQCGTDRLFFVCRKLLEFPEVAIKALQRLPIDELIKHFCETLTAPQPAPQPTQPQKPQKVRITHFKCHS